MHSTPALATSRRVSTIHATDIFRSCQLTLTFGRVCPLEWTAENVLDRASQFFINTYLDLHSFIVLC
jgi:hypothetical protein